MLITRSPFTEMSHTPATAPAATWSAAAATPTSRPFVESRTSPAPLTEDAAAPSAQRDDEADELHPLFMQSVPMGGVEHNSALAALAAIIDEAAEEEEVCSRKRKTRAVDSTDADPDTVRARKLRPPASGPRRTNSIGAAQVLLALL